MVQPIGHFQGEYFAPPASPPEPNCG
ncbi:uncharacterized protein METZ01_LOCUS214417, partial [marine metagenome]